MPDAARVLDEERPSDSADEDEDPTIDTEDDDDGSAVEGVPEDCVFVENESDDARELVELLGVDRAANV